MRMVTDKPTFVSIRHNPKRKCPRTGKPERAQPTFLNCHAPGTPILRTVPNPKQNKYF